MARSDPHSYAESSQPQTRSISFDLRVDFAARVVAGEIVLQFREPGDGPLDLDTRDLKIESVQSLDGAGLAFELARPEPILGSRLRIEPPCCAVWAERSLADAAAFEFAEVEKMLGAAEALFGPYDWDRYDVLVMPPSFPYGGMENPRLTFVTPSLLAGDRSLVNVIAHELAHAWTGNLVTQATANDFWLNEGFTVYAERRILEALEGRDFSELHAAIGRHDLEVSLERFAK